MQFPDSDHRDNQKPGGLLPFSGAFIRKDVQSWIIQVLSRGECCSMVGPSNTGKSLLLRMLLDHSTRKISWPPEETPPLLVFIDCLDCAGESELAFYELILRRIHQTMVQADFEMEYVDELQDLRADLLNANNPVEIRAHFAIGMHTIGCIPEINLVLIFDEFDDIFRTQSPWPFRQLRAIRDTLGNRLCYLTATSRYLKDLRNDTETYEFRELFQMHTQVLKSLSVADQQTLLGYLITTHHLKLNTDPQNIVLHLAGGHPGFLTRIALSIQQEGIAEELSDMLTKSNLSKAEGEICRRLLRVEPLRDECRRLWSELESQEQTGLMQLVEDNSSGVDPVISERLIGKGLLISCVDESTKIFSPLFQSFLIQEATYFHHRGPQGVQCNEFTGQIWVDGKEITFQLSDLQRKLIRHLHSQNGSTCTHQEIVTAVWGAGEGVSPGAVYELVKRVREKIEKDWKNPAYLLTVSGEGYRLERPV
ncbi:MAG: winged helix-turn-helix domain-containing protein [Anaerolineales bacterium]